MTNQEKRELNEKLARWRWPGYDIFIWQDKAIWRQPHPNAVMGDCIFLCDLFTHSLDACFTHLEPMLLGYALFKQGKTHVAFVFCKDPSKKGYAIAKTPAMAFCLACEKSIDAEGE